MGSWTPPTASPESKGWPETRSPLTGEALARLDPDELRGIVDAADSLAGQTARHLPSERTYRATLEREAQRLDDLVGGKGQERLPGPALEWDR